MIELKHLGKIYSSASGSVEALKDVNLTIADGEMFGIIGLSQNMLQSQVGVISNA